LYLCTDSGMIIACSYLHGRFSLFVSYRVATKSIHQKYYVVLTGMLRYKPVTEFVERYYSTVNCTLSADDLISNNFCEFYNTEISDVF
jgi:hypothetical protein